MKKNILPKIRNGQSVVIDMNTVYSTEGADILGVNPPVFDFAFMDLWSKPLGLLYILQSLREKNNVSLLDCVAFAAKGERTFGRARIAKEEIDKPEVYNNIPRHFNRFGLSEKEITKHLATRPAPDCILLTSAMTYWYKGVEWIIKLLNKIYPDTPIVLGGIYASLCAEHAAALGADYIVKDRSEPAAPYPAMDLYGTPPYGVVMTSFGCPFSCGYCASRVLWKRYRRRSISDTMREIEFQYSVGARDFAFYDDALLIDKENFFYPMCREISHRFGNEIRLHTPNGLHVREINERCAEILYSSGFKTIRLSLESVDERVAHESCDKVARNEYAAAVKNLLNAGYTHKDCETYILLGLPGQNINSVKDTITFAKECGGTPKLAEFSPIPHTPLFEKCALKIPALRSEPLLQNNSVYCSYIAKEIAPEALQKLKDLAKSRTELHR
ncbi:MAG: radical SAM protein [Synergistes sp.]|nr:radical SAM protein [Synergistes sp.]